MRLLQLKKYLRWFQSNLEYISIALENTHTKKKQDHENRAVSIAMVIEGF